MVSLGVMLTMLTSYYVSQTYIKLRNHIKAFELMICVENNCMTALFHLEGMFLKFFSPYTLKSKDWNAKQLKGLCGQENQEGLNARISQAVIV